MITMQNVSFAYGKRDPLFTNLNLQLKPGMLCGLLGKNGSGKTTLLKIIAGLLFPKTGDCQVMQQLPRQRHPSFLQEIYFLPEDLFVPRLTMADYVKCYASFYPRFDAATLQQCIAEFDLPQQKYLTEFSYGQKKKFLIAFGLATHCRLLILDEPTNGLDIPSKAQFRKLLASQISDEKLFIISTHQVHDVENLIDTLVILDEGKIILQENLFTISERIAISQQTTAPDLQNCWYYEKNLSGYIVVSLNSNKQDTHMDLEILFNAILSNKNKISQLFPRN